MTTATIRIVEDTPRNYQEFLRSKIVMAAERGAAVAVGDMNPKLFPHQRAIACWAIRGGRRAIFAAFGLGKTLIQIQILHSLLSLEPGHAGLITCPLGVKGEFANDARDFFGIEFAYVRTNEEFRALYAAGQRYFITNYERVRDGQLDPRLFEVTSLDEASILRGFGGTKTFREFMRLFESVRYRFVATATPSPNEYIELLAYAAYLGIMDVGEAKTRFFKRNSEKADQLTLHPHKEREFWLWVSTWAIFLQKPSDLGYSDDGYQLPEMQVRWHEVPTDHKQAGMENSGQGRLLQNSAIGVQEAAREKRSSLGRRVEKLLELRAEDPGAHRVIWHDLEDERRAIEQAIPTATSIYGQQELEEREQAIADFSYGRIQELAAKPVLAGSGCNFQRHCAWAIFLGIGFKFNDFIQACHRIQRFLQTKTVRIDLIYTEAERNIRQELQRKWDQHVKLVEQMSEIIRTYGLASHVAEELQRSMGVERVEVRGESYTAVNNDCVVEMPHIESDSVHLILTSIPFSTQYEYTPSYNDFGHTDSNAHFWQQMDFLTPELLRVLQPGRNAIIHVKDRIVPGGLTGLGFQTVYEFSDDCVRHFKRHGFAYLARKTIVTDVVRENNQTYRLGWTEQCKDGSRMGCGMPEYLLLFRKPPSDPSNGYADAPVVKSKSEYSRSRWQIDAHGFLRSNGDRLLAPEDFVAVPHERMFKLFRDYFASHVYDYEQHIKLSESLERCAECGHIHTGQKRCGTCPCDKAADRLPKKFMLLQPPSWHPDAWTDVARMRSLNGAQSAAGRENHLCPLQFDICDRVITQFSMEGELVFDPFAGLFSVPARALKLGRRGYGVELNPRYFADGVGYCHAAENKVVSPTLFEMLPELSQAETKEG